MFDLLVSLIEAPFEIVYSLFETEDETNYRRVEQWASSLTDAHTGHRLPKLAAPQSILTAASALAVVKPTTHRPRALTATRGTRLLHCLLSE